MQKSDSEDLGTQPEVETLVDPPESVVSTLREGLYRYNLSKLGDYTWLPLAVVARSADGTIIGGLYGDLMWGWFHIDILWVHPDHRGKDLGTAIMDEAEAAAVARGISHFHLETTSFQALDFYLRRGYEIAGQLENKPPGATWYFLKKEVPEGNPQP